MNRHFILFALVFAAALSASAKTFDVDISTGRPAASNEAFYHGETIEFRAVRGRSVVTNIEYSCIWYTTNNSSSVASGEGGWWKTDGLVFHPTNDCGAAAYRFFLEGRDEIGRDWHANGLLRFLPSPGFEPNAIERPVLTLDFASIEVINPPWSDTDLTPATNYTDAVAGQVRAAIPTDNAQLANGAGYVTAAITNGLQLTETDPTVPSWAKEPSAPLPPDYATVSNRAMSALQSYTETDPKFTAWADAHVFYDGNMVDWAIDAMYALKLGDGFSTTYSAEDITAISNGFAAADESLSSRLSLASLAATNYTDAAIGAAIANTNPVFSNAVLSVGLGIDTNTVAAINALVEAGDELPIGGATSVGALLLALAAAVAALKRTKADASALRYAFAATIQPTAGTAAPTGTLTDRAEIKVVCTEATGQTGSNAKLTLTLPPAVPGYVRDFLVKIDRTTSGCYSVDFVPYGDESVSYETADGSMPEVPDGAVTWLSFTESESGGVFAVRATPLVAVTGGV